MKFDSADGEATVDQWIVHVSSEVSPDFITAILVPVFHLPKAEQEGKQDGDTADGLANIRCGLNVH